MTRAERRLLAAILAALLPVASSAQQATDYLAQARAELARGNGVAAEALVARAREAGTPADESRAELAEALLLEGTPARALDEASDAPDDDPASARMRGRALLQLDRTDEALAAFNQAIRIAPSDPMSWVDLGRFQLALGDVASAIAASNEAARRGPRSAPAMLLRAETVRIQFGLAASIPWYDRAVALAPADLDALLGRAATLGDLGRTRAMLADTRAVLKIRAGNPRALYLQAVLAARARDFDLARTLLDRTGGRLDGEWGVMLLHGAIEYQGGNDELAIDWLRRLVAGQPGNLKARRLLGAALLRSGDTAGAVETLGPLGGAWTNDSYSLLLLARAAEKSGDAAGAARYRARAARPGDGSGFGPPLDPDSLQALRNAAAADPRSSDARLELVEALIRTHLPAEGVAQAADLARIYPGAPQAHLMLGDALVAAGRTAEAVESYRRAAGIAFTEPAALRLIDAYLRGGRTAQARRVLDIYLDQNPQSVPAGLIRANLMMAAAEWDDATDELDALRLRLGSRDALLLNNLAWSHWQAGDRAEALTMAARALGLAGRVPAVQQSAGFLFANDPARRGRGIALLEAAARSAPGSPTVRWNLARAYALAGRAPQARAQALAALALPGFADRAAAWTLSRD